MEEGMDDVHVACHEGDAVSWQSNIPSKGLVGTALLKALI